MQDQKQKPQLGEGGQKPTPEQQAAYDRYVGAAMMHIYTPKVIDKIVQSISPEDPVATMGRAAANVGFVVMKKAEQDGQKVPPEVLLHGGKEVVAAIAELYERKGGQELAPEQVEQAYYVAADDFRQMMQGEGSIDPESAQQGMQELQAMAQSGAFDEEAG